MKKDPHNDDEIVFEGEFDSQAVDFDKKVKKLKEDLHKCQEEKAQYLDGWQRSQADFINYKKRAGEDAINFRKYANEDLVISILPIIVNFLNPHDTRYGK
jgi:molecular chaperone GrpE